MMKLKAIQQLKRRLGKQYVAPLKSRLAKRYIEPLQSRFNKQSGDWAAAKGILEQASARNLLDADVLLMMKGIFNVQQMHVREIMVPRSKMIAISYRSSLEDIMTTVIDSGHSRFPVIGDDLDDIRGILLAKDLLPVLKEKPAALDLGDYLRQPVLIPYSKRLSMLLKEFRKNRNHIAIVVDEYGGICGLVTIEDVLEQIVGDISDEHDSQSEHYIYNHGDQSYLVQALTPIDYFNRYFTVNIETRESTIGGAMLEWLGHIPVKDEHIEKQGLLLRVTETSMRQIELLYVEKLS